MDEPKFRLRLRGGASTKRLPSEERVPRSVWFLAGGLGKPPTGREMREWKRQDREQVKNKTGKEKEKFWPGFVRAIVGGRKIAKNKGKQSDTGEAAQMADGGGDTNDTG